MSTRSCSGRVLRLAVALAALLLAPACATLTVEQEQDLARSVEQQIRSQYRFINDRVVNEYVSDIGWQIVQNAGPQPFEYHFYVIDDEDINAFAAPGGNIYINSGTILKARNVSELAGVMGHEVGHVALRHLAENYGRQRAAGIGHQALVLGAGMLGGSAAAMGADMVGGAGLGVALNSFGRDDEREADDFAVVVLPRAGYDPSGLPTFFETLSREGERGGPAFLSSHPAPADRMADTRAEIASADLPPGLEKNDGGRLEIIQRRILLLTGKTGSGR